MEKNTRNDTTCVEETSNVVVVRSEVGTMFCLSWLITWYGHVLSEFRQIVRLYDFFMACHPLMPIYLAADVSVQRLSWACSITDWIRIHAETSFRFTRQIKCPFQI